MKLWKRFRKAPITIRAALIGGGFVLLSSAVSPIISRILHPIEVRGDSALKLVEMSVERDDEFPLLDFKIRNVGDQPAFLKDVTIHVEKVWEVAPLMAPAAVEVSWVYNVSLPVSGAPYQEVVPISQAVPAADVDRFQLRIGNDGAPGLQEYVFLVWTELVYDEDEKTLRSDSLLFTATPASRVMAATGLGGTPWADSLMEHNYRVVEEIKALPARRGPSIESLLDVVTSSYHEWTAGNGG